MCCYVSVLQDRVLLCSVLLCVQDRALLVPVLQDRVLLVPVLQDRVLQDRVLLVPVLQDRVLLVFVYVLQD